MDNLQFSPFFWFLCRADREKILQNHTLKDCDDIASLRKNRLIDAHTNILASVFATLHLKGEGSFLTSQQIVSILVDLELGDNNLGGIDGDVNGLTFL